jgi:hypothetical protein
VDEAKAGCADSGLYVVPGAIPMKQWMKDIAFDFLVVGVVLVALCVVAPLLAVAAILISGGHPL